MLVISTNHRIFLGAEGGTAASRRWVGEGHNGKSTVPTVYTLQKWFGYFNQMLLVEEKLVTLTKMLWPIAGIFRRAGGGTAASGRREGEGNSGKATGPAMAAHHGVQSISNNRGNCSPGGRFSLHLLCQHHGTGS